MGPEGWSRRYLLLQRKPGLIQGVTREMLFNQPKRDFDPDLHSLGLQDVKFWGKVFAYNIPSEEAAVRVHGYKAWQGLLAAHALLVGSSLRSDYMFKCFHAVQQSSSPAISTWMSDKRMHYHYLHYLLIFPEKFCSMKC